jgi:hypothetical protein
METTNNVNIYVAYPDKPKRSHLYCDIGDIEDLNELPNTHCTTCLNCVRTYNSEKGLESHMKHVNSKQHQIFIKVFKKNI